jgi:hypothetical protein
VHAHGTRTHLHTHTHTHMHRLATWKNTNIRIPIHRYAQTSAYNNYEG